MPGNKGNNSNHLINNAQWGLAYMGVGYQKSPAVYFNM